MSRPSAHLTRSGVGVGTDQGLGAGEALPAEVSKIDVPMATLPVADEIGHELTHGR
jgi:hypothetical protein